MSAPLYSLPVICVYSSANATLSSCSFIVSLKIGQHDSSNFLRLFFFFSKTFLAIPVPLPFYTHFRISLSIPARDPAGVLIGTVLNTKVDPGGNWHPCYAESSNPWTQYVFPTLFSLSD